MENLDINTRKILLELAIQAVDKARVVVLSDLKHLSSNILALEESLVLFDKKVVEVFKLKDEADAVMRDFFGNNYK